MTEESNENVRGEGSRQGAKRRYNTRYVRKPRFCQFCSDKSLILNYKNTTVLRKLTTEEGKIRPRRQTGTCAKHQRAVAREIKRARHIALLPFSGGTWEENIR